MQDRTASSGLPGMGERDHPASQPEPKMDAYENGDFSSWAEDVKPPPYPKGKLPAIPGAGESDHPASRQARLRVAKVKARKAMRIATYMLGDFADDTALEEQVMDLMNLPDPILDDTLARCASTRKASEDEEGDDKPEPEAKEPEGDDEPAEDETPAQKEARYTRLANFWARKARASTPPAKAKLPRRATEGADDEAMLAQMLAEADAEGDGVDEEAEAMLAEMLAECEPEAPVASEDDDEALLAEMVKEEARKAAKSPAKPKVTPKAAAPKAPARKAADEEPPAEDDDEALLAEMLNEEPEGAEGGDEGEEPAAEEETPKTADELEDEGGLDPLGYEGEDAGDDTDLSVLFEDEDADSAEAAKKAKLAEIKAARLAGSKKPSTAVVDSGAKPSRTARTATVRTLGQVPRATERSQIASLEDLWPKTPRLSDLD